MKRKFTLLIAALALLTMIVQPGRAWGQTKTEQTASYGFETGDAGWTATNFVTNNTAITAHGGSKYGATNGGSTASVTYDSQVANPLSLTCYYSKTTTNTNAGSHFEIQVSTDNSTWTKVAEGNGMNNVTKGTWYELSADLSSYSNVYIRVYYTGTSAVRALDDITLTYDDGQTPSTDPEITFSPASISLEDVILGQDASATFTVSQANLTSDITLSVDNGSLSTSSITQGAEATSVTWNYTPSAAGDFSATVTATSGTTTQTLEITGNAIAPVEGYDVDFEYATNMYPNWTFTNMESHQTGSITAHDGTYYGTTGGKATASITTKEKVANPGTLTCFVSKQSGNTTSSTWYIQVSGNGSEWTNVKNQSATSMSSGTWVEFTADLSSYSDVYVRVYYTGSTAVRNIDDLSLTTATPATVATPTFSPASGTEFGNEGLEVTISQADNKPIYYTLNGSEPTSSSTLYEAPFQITTTTTVKARAYDGENASNVATAIYTYVDPDAPGTQNNPYTVAQAIENTPTSGTTGDVYIHGIVSAFYNNNTTILDDNSHRYYISDDGSTSSQLLVYNGKGLNNVAFSNVDDLLIGDEITLVGKLKTYSNAPEVDGGNYIVSLVRPSAPVATPTFNPEAGVYTEAQNVEISCETEGSTIYYTTDGTEPTNASTEYTEELNVTTTTTFKAIAIKGNDVSTVTTATYHINSQANPYTVAQALAFYEYPANSIYVHGIVSTAPTQAPTNNGELTYYISDNGEATNQLEVYKGKGLEQAAFTAQDDIQVGDIVTIYGNVQVYNNVIEFGSGNYLVSFYREPVLETENVNIACDATEGVITYTVTNPASDGNLTAEITDGNEDNWLTLGTIGANVPFTCTANTGAERTATVTLTYTYNTTETVTATAVVTQAAYVAPVASITVDPATVNAPAAETDGTLTVTYTDIATDLGASIFWYTDNTGTETTTEPEWISADIDDITLNVEYLIDANTGEARTAYLKVHAFDDDANDVYSDLVTINQAAYVVDYATLPFAYDGNGLGTLPNGLTQEGLTDKYNNSPKMKFDGTGDWLLLHINERPGTLTFNIKGNSFGGDSEFKVQTSADGTNYTDLATYTDLTSTVQSEEFDNLDGNIRYIKWIYTNKDAGNVALGNIALAQYVEPQPSITINPGPYNLNSEGGDAELEVTYSNMPTDPQAVVIFYESNGETPLTENPTWITATINANGNVDGHIDANDGDARSAYFKVKGIDADGNDVYSGLVTVNQAAYTLSIVFETTSLDIEAGGEQDRIISFEYQGLGENPTFEVRTYDVTGETQTTYDWLTTSITQGHKVSINVAENTGDARSAYFKVYGENGTVNTESNLVTINQAAAGVTYTLVESDEDLEAGVHYIIAGKNNLGAWYAMGKHNGNNRKAIAVVVTDNTITETDEVHEFVISGDGDNFYTIYDEDTKSVGSNGYLYAAGASSNNYLKTYDSYDNKGQWTIEIDGTTNVASITANMEGRNLMRFNNSSGIFSCYASNQDVIYLYKKDNDVPTHYYSPSVVTVTEDVDASVTPVVVLENEILTLTGSLTSSGPDDIVINDGGQLVFDGTGVKATMKKKTVGESKAEHWYTIASPVNNIDFANITNLTNATTFDLYRYDEATYTWENYKNTAHTDFVTAENGRGYLYYNSDGNELSFAGELNNSASYDLTASGAQMNGLNLIGNPFTQDITLANISLSDDAQISEGFYVLSNNSDWVASVTTVKPCEGFIVKVNKATKATFSKSTGSSKSRANRDYIAFTVANNQYEDVAYAMFSNGLGLDKINHRNADIPMVYIPQNGQNYAIATMDDNTQAFELNFKAMTTGQYTLSYKAEGKYSYLHVIDRLTGEDIDMLLDGEYSFIGSPRDNEARFIVKLSYNANIDEIEVNDNFAYQNGSDIIVNGNGELQVFDVTGRMVMNTKINGIQTVNVPATGMYIFRMVGESVQTQKIVVR